MSKLPDTRSSDEWDPLIVRTHYGDDRAWEAVKQALMPLTDGPDEFRPWFVDDPRWDGASVNEVVAAIAANEMIAQWLRVVFVADRTAMATGRPALLAVTAMTREGRGNERGRGFEIDPGCEFRAVGRAVFAVHTEFQLGDRDFLAFSGVAVGGPEGVYRRCRADEYAPGPAAAVPRRRGSAGSPC